MRKSKVNPQAKAGRCICRISAVILPDFWLSAMEIAPLAGDRNMLPIFATLMEWCPRISLWILAPAVLLLILVAFRKAARARCLLGFMILASLSALLLLMGVLLIVGGYGSAVLHVFQSFGPIETVNFLATLLPGIASQLGNLLPTFATALGAGIAAFILRREVRISRPAAETAR